MVYGWSVAGDGVWLCMPVRQGRAGIRVLLSVHPTRLRSVRRGRLTSVEITFKLRPSSDLDDTAFLQSYELAAAGAALALRGNQNAGDLFLCAMPRSLKESLDVIQLNPLIACSIHLALAVPTRW